MAVFSVQLSFVNSFARQWVLVCMASQLSRISVVRVIPLDVCSSRNLSSGSRWCGRRKASRRIEMLRIVVDAKLVLFSCSALAERVCTLSLPEGDVRFLSTVCNLYPTCCTLSARGSPRPLYAVLGGPRVIISHSKPR